MTTSAVVRAELVDSKGRVVRLSEQIGRGGEGIVYKVSGRDAVVAKIYRQPPDDKLTNKLQAMAHIGSDRLRGVSAWPLDTVRDSASGSVTGILLPYVKDAKSIHLLYGPKTRRNDFPKEDWRFLVHSAGNAARAFRVIHECGHVVGDINEQNLLVQKDSTVKFIDCDSFQIRSGGQVFSCDVGVPSYTPPELQGERLRGLQRNRNHDHFGLAVLIFHLLFMGRHPFAGRYLGHGDLHVPDAIKSFRFAYGADARQRMMQPPPAAPPFNSIAPDVAKQFERAFSVEAVRSNARPDSVSWMEALTRFETELVQCKANAFHYYYSRAGACTWCHLFRETGTDYFPAPAKVLNDGPPSNGMTLEELWKQIKAVPSPGSPPHMPAPGDFQANPIPEALDHGETRRERRERFHHEAIKYGLAPGLLITILTYVFSTPLYALFVAWTLIVGYAVARHYYSLSGIKPFHDQMKSELNAARTEYDEAVKRWDEQATNKRFRNRLDELKRKRERYLSLERDRKNRENQLLSTLRERQRERHMENQRIADANIPGIGPSRISTLRSYGIETAADVSEEAIERLPRFGPRLTMALVKWRTNCEQAFRFNPNEGLPPEDLAELDRDFESKKRNVLHELTHGEGKLKKIAKEIKDARVSLLPDLKVRAEKCAQAEANWNAM